MEYVTLVQAIGIASVSMSYIVRHGYFDEMFHFEMFHFVQHDIEYR